MRQLNLIITSSYFRAPFQDWTFDAQVMRNKRKEQHDVDQSQRIEPRTCRSKNAPANKVSRTFLEQAEAGGIRENLATEHAARVAVGYLHLRKSSLYMRSWSDAILIPHGARDAEKAGKSAWIKFGFCKALLAVQMFRLWLGIRSSLSSNTGSIRNAQSREFTRPGRNAGGVGNCRANSCFGGVCQ